MKPAVTRIGLVVLVLVVWGAVIARALVKPPIPDLPEAVTLPDPKHPPTERSGPIQFRLARDPFIGRTTDRMTTSVGNRPRSETRGTTKPPPPAPVNQPDQRIEYIGYIRSDKGTGNTCVLLAVNGKEVIATVGVNTNGLEVTEATPRSVTIQRNGKELIIPRKS